MFPVYFPFSSQEEPRTERERRCLQSFHPYNSLCMYVSLCLCAYGAMDQMTFFFFFSDLYTSVVLFNGYIESMCFFFLFFFCESSVGKRAVWVDLSDLIFIF